MTSLSYGQSSPTGVSLPHDFRRPPTSFSSYDHPSRRRSPSPGPSVRRQPYDSYKPRDVAPYRDDHLNNYRPNAYRPEQFYTRSPSPPRYDRSRPQEPRQWDNGSRWQSSSYYDRRSTPSPPQWETKRRDTMAERMFEPSDNWKQSHADRPTRYEPSESALDRYGERRQLPSRDFSPQRPPARTDSASHYGGDRYRPHQVLQTVRDLGSFSRTADTYRPQYLDDSRPPSHTTDGIGCQRRSSYHEDEDEHPGSSIASTPPRLQAPLGPSLSKSQYRSPSPPSRQFTQAEMYRSTPRRYSIHDDGYRTYSPSVSRSRGSSISEEPPRKKFRSRSSSRSSNTSRLPRSGISEEPPLFQMSIQSDTAIMHTKAFQHVLNIVSTTSHDNNAPSEGSTSPGTTIVTSTDKQLPSHKTIHVNGSSSSDREILEHNALSPPTPELAPCNDVTLLKESPHGAVTPHVQVGSMTIDFLGETPEGSSLNSGHAAAPGLAASVEPASVIMSISAIDGDERRGSPLSSTVTPSPVSQPLEKDPGATACVEVDVDQITANTTAPDPIADSFQIVVSDHSTIPTSPPPTDRSFVYQPEHVDLKSTREGLRFVVLARLRCDRQSRAERVFPVLRANQVVSNRDPVPPPSDCQGHLFEELDVDSRCSDRLATNDAIRSSLVDRFVKCQSEIVEKSRRLRVEYLALHEKWLEHCARLDDVQKVGVQEESAIPSGGRATRRSTAVMGDAVRSDLEMEQIIASLGVEELTDPSYLAIKNVAKIPDMISVTEGSVPYLFDDTNNLVDDPAEFYGASSGQDYWTEEERNTFLNEFAAHPKQFGRIAEHLPNKTPAQCITYYYLHKKQGVDFRKAVAQYGSGRRRKNGRANKQRGNALLADIRRHDDEVSRVSSGTPNENTTLNGNKRKRAILRANGESRRSSTSRRTTIQPEATPTSSGTTPDPEADQQRRKRRTAVSARAVTVVTADNVVNGGATELPSQDPAPKPARKPRKPRKSKGQAAAPPSEEPPTPTIELSTPIEQQEPAARRKSSPTPNTWSEDDKSSFIPLLCQYGDDFPRISASMPNKTTMQVSNYYNSNICKLNRERDVAVAPKRFMSSAVSGTVPYSQPYSRRLQISDLLGAPHSGSELRQPIAPTHVYGEHLSSWSRSPLQSQLFPPPTHFVPETANPNVDYPTAPYSSPDHPKFTCVRRRDGEGLAYDGPPSHRMSHLAPNVIHTSARVYLDRANVKQSQVDPLHVHPVLRDPRSSQAGDLGTAQVNPQPTSYLSGYCDHLFR